MIKRLSFVLIFAAAAWPCSVTGIMRNTDMVKNADAVVRATAVEYAVPPSNPNLITSGVPDSTIRFRVEENIRGITVTDLVLHGYLINRDDFNDQTPPYSFVRPLGRRGSCFANSYRTGAQFLLFLKKNPAGELIVEWVPLGPVNEQLHSDSDPWLLWVRDQAHQEAAPPPKKR